MAIRSAAAIKAWNLGAITASLAITGTVLAPPAARSAGVLAPSWSTAEPVSPDGWSSLDRPTVLVDRTGTTTLAWVGTDNNFFEPRGLVVRRKPFGAAWQPEQVVDPVGGTDPDLAADRDGNVTVVYGQPPGPRYYRRSYPAAVSIQPDGIISEPVLLATEARVWDRVLVIVDSDGDATAAWIAYDRDGSGGRRVAVAQRANGGPWSTARYLHSPATNASQLSMDVAPDGEVTVLWVSRQSDRGAFSYQVRARSFIDGRWRDVQRVSRTPDREVFDPIEVSAGVNGTAVASWTHPRDEAPLRLVATRRRDGTWTAPRRVREPGYGSVQFARSGGRLMEAWTRTQGSFTDLLARVRNGRQWGETQVISRPRGSVGLVAVDDWAGGRFRVAWTYQRPPSSDGAIYSVRSRDRGTAGAWSTESVLSDPRVYFDSLALALGPGRSSAAAWKQLDDDTAFGKIFHAEANPGAPD